MTSCLFTDVSQFNRFRQQVVTGRSFDAELFRVYICFTNAPRWTTLNFADLFVVRENTKYITALDIRGKPFIAIPINL